jgi:iron complex transport system substrate-binding protein
MKPVEIGTNGHKRALHLSAPPKRVVSLVPSLTESLFDLGLGESVVGITDFCAHPLEGLKGLQRLGGPKNPRTEDIIALNPDLVLVNQEENTPQTVNAMEAAGLSVWVTFPKTVRQSLDVLWAIVGIFRNQEAAIRLQYLEKSVEWAESALAEQQPRRVFCPIWQSEMPEGMRWWMTFNQDTYIHDLLRLVGGQNVFAERQRNYPLEADLGLVEAQEPGKRDTRYPRVTIDEIIRMEPDVVLLPSEPFSFTKSHREEIKSLLSETPAVQEGWIYLVDGSLLTWHGTRLARSLQELPTLFI